MSTVLPYPVISRPSSRRVVELAGIGFVMVILLAGPEDLAAVNPRPVYGRMTGCG